MKAVKSNVTKKPNQSFKEREGYVDDRKFKKVLERSTCASFRAEGIPFKESELKILSKIAKSLKQKD